MFFKSTIKKKTQHTSPIILIFTVILLYSQYLCAQDRVTTLRGQHPSFAGQRLEFVVESDFISKLPRIVAKTTADTTGAFSAELNLTETTLVTVNFGKFSGVIYAEASRDYNLLLPSFEHKNIADSLNPYFEPIRFFFKIKNPVLPELNDAIANLDNIINQFLSDNLSYLLKYRYFSQIDTLGSFIDTLFCDIKNPFFNTYKKYSLAYIYAIIRLSNDQSLIKQYLMNTPIFYNNPGYTSFFEQIFTDYLPVYSETIYGKRILYDIARAKSYKFAMETLSNNPVLKTDALKELVLIKSIYDAIVEEQLPKSSCMQTLDSIRILTKIEKHKEIITNIKEKLQILAVGATIPDFELHDSECQTVTPQQLQGKYLYLTFLNIKSSTALNELESLNALNKKYNSRLRIVTIIVGSGSFDETKKMFLDNKYEWKLLDGTKNQKIEKDYNIQSSLTCYLASSDLKLVMSPAQGPTEKFEYAFIEFLREDRIRELRNSKQEDTKETFGY